MVGKLLRLAGPGVTEYTVLKSALKNFNLPRVITNDKPIFEMLCEDLFSKLPVNSESGKNYMEKTSSARPRIHQEIPTGLPLQKRLRQADLAGDRNPRDAPLHVRHRPCGLGQVRGHPHPGRDLKYTRLADQDRFPLP